MSLVEKFKNVLDLRYQNITEYYVLTVTLQKLMLL